MADSAFSARGAARPLKKPPSRPGHDVLFRAWITTTRHSAGSARSPQSSSCSRWRLSEGCSTVPPGRAATATPSLPTARRPLRHRRRSAVRSVGESRSGRCAGSFASSHNWLKRGQSPTRLWGAGAQRRRNAVRQLLCEGMRRRWRPCARFASGATRVFERTAFPARYRDARSRSLAAQRSARQTACVGCEMRRAWQSSVAGDPRGPRRSSGLGWSPGVLGPRCFASLYIR